MKKWLCGLAMACMILPPCAAADEAGLDLPPVFARAAKGEPLRYVALGGSITYGGKGCIGDWLKERFPSERCDGG